MVSTAVDRNDGLSSSTAVKGPCRVATTANITLSGEQTINGIAVVTDDRVLVKDQTIASQNGIYVADTGPWRRAKDFEGNRDVREGTRVWVTDGTGAPTEYAVTTANPIVIGTTSITFAQSYLGSLIGATGLQMLAASTAKIGRGVLGQVETVNYFDYVPIAEWAGISSGSDTTTDQSTYWQAFRDALNTASLAGKRPHGVIPQCVIRTSTAPNFAMDYLTLEFEGEVKIIATGAVSGMRFDGTGLGQGGFGSRFLNIGSFAAGTTTGSIGIQVKNCHQSHFAPMQSLGAANRGIVIDACVSSDFSKPVVSASPTSFLATPSVAAIQITGGVGTQTSYCTFRQIIAEDCPTGVLLDYALGNCFLGGVAERNVTGWSTTANAEANGFFKLDAEANSGDDYSILGLYNEFYGCDAADGTVLFTGTGAVANRWFGGVVNTMSFTVGATLNLVRGLVYNRSGTGTLTDGVGTNRISGDCYDAAAGTYFGDAWTQVSVTPSSGTGALGASPTATYRYKRIEGKTYAFELEVSTPNNGTGATSIVVSSLPAALAPNRRRSWSGAEEGISFQAVKADQAAAATTMTIKFYDGTYPGSSGALIYVSGIIETA